MRSMLQIGNTPNNKGCKECDPNWGNLGKCGKHTPVIANMVWYRKLWELIKYPRYTWPRLTH